MKLSGYGEDGLVPISLGANELLALEAIESGLKANAILVVCLESVRYYTGQLLDIKRIVEMCHAYGALCVMDLAHGIGNVPLELHNWGVDAACWCSYKYLNSGPGGIGGIFIHSKHHHDNVPKLNGWWSHEKATRFEMKHEYKPAKGAKSWAMSNPGVFQMMALLGSLQVYAKTSMQKLREKSLVTLATLYFHPKNAF